MSLNSWLTLKEPFVCCQNKTETKLETMPRSSEFNDDSLVKQARSSINVYAKNCLFFAWAPDGYQGPQNWPIGGYESGDDYRPAVLDVTGYAEIELEASADVYWRHGASSDWRSNAGGIGGSIAYTDARYRSDINNAQHILQNDAIELNKLVGMFGGNYDNPPSEINPSHILPVGLAARLPIPAGATHMYLGMHDGYEWSTNFNEDDAPVVVEATLYGLT